MFDVLTFMVVFFGGNMTEFILFIMSFVLVFIIYQIFIIIPAKKRNNSKKKNNKELLEIRYLETKYKLDMKKIKYEQLLQICAFVSSFDISLAVTLVCLVNGLLMELLVGFISIIVLIFISYHLVYLFYKKKGMIKNGKHK